MEDFSSFASLSNNPNNTSNDTSGAEDDSRNKHNFNTLDEETDHDDNPDSSKSIKSIKGRFTQPPLLIGLKRLFTDPLYMSILMGPLLSLLCSGAYTVFLVTLSGLLGAIRVIRVM